MFAAILAAPLAAASHQSDAGSGSDAPGDWTGALPVGTSGFQGTIDPGEGDVADWYVATMPSAFLAFVSAAFSGTDLAYELRRANGETIAFSDSPLWCDQNGCGNKEQVATFSTGGPFYLGVHARGGPGEYSIGFDIREPSNSRIVRAEVVDRPVGVDEASLLVGTQRTIEVTVVNDGPGASYGAWVSATISHDIGGNRGINGAGLSDLAPGARAVLSLEWDGTGEVGDVRVDVHLGAMLDLADWDNHAQTRGSVLIHDVGIGVDALNNGVGHCEPDVGCAFVGVESNEWRDGLVGDAGTGDSWVAFHAGGHPGTEHVQTSGNVGGDPFDVDLGLFNGRAHARACHPTVEGCRGFG